MSEIEFKNIMQTVKKILKTKGLSYKDLAQKLSMSEAGIKRLLNANECGLKRLIQICQVIDISIEDLIQTSNSLQVEVQRFTDDQKSLFENSLIHLKFYYKLKVEKLTSETAKRHLKLTKQQYQQILFDLDRTNLIELHPNDEVKILGSDAVYWNEVGDSFQNFKFEFARNLIDGFVNDYEKEGSFFPIYHLNLSEMARNDFFHELNQLVLSHAKRSVSDSFLLSKDKFNPLTIAFVASQGYAFEN